MNEKGPHGLMCSNTQFPAYGTFTKCEILGGSVPCGANSEVFKYVFLCLLSVVLIFELLVVSVLMPSLGSHGIYQVKNIKHFLMCLVHCVLPQQKNILKHRA